MCRCAAAAFRVADQLRQWGQQVRARREHPGQGALGQVEPVVGQRGDDPVRGAAQHELLHQQPGQKPGGEPALADRLGHRCGDQDPADRATAAAPVGRAAVHDPGQLDLPVDLLAALLAEPGIARAAARAHPLGLGNVVDLLAGRQMRVVPAAVPARAPPLPTTALVRLPVAQRRHRSPVAARRRLGRLLRRRPERQPRQHRHLLGERPDLTLQVSDPGPQRDVVRRQPLRLAPPPLGTPELDAARLTEITAAHDAGTRSPPAGTRPAPTPHGVSQTARRHPNYGITECLLTDAPHPVWPIRSRDSSAATVARSPPEAPPARPRARRTARQSQPGAVKTLDERHLSDVLAPQRLDPRRKGGRVAHLLQIHEQIHRDVVARGCLLRDARRDPRSHCLTLGRQRLQPLPPRDLGAAGARGRSGRPSSALRLLTLFPLRRRPIEQLGRGPTRGRASRIDRAPRCVAARSNGSLPSNNPTNSASRSTPDRPATHRATSTRASYAGGAPVAATSMSSGSILRNSTSADCDPVGASNARRHRRLHLVIGHLADLQAQQPRQVQRAHVTGQQLGPHRQDRGQHPFPAPLEVPTLVLGHPSDDHMTARAATPSPRRPGSTAAPSPDRRAVPAAAG